MREVTASILTHSCLRLTLEVGHRFHGRLVVGRLD